MNDPHREQPRIQRLEDDGQQWSGPPVPQRGPPLLSRRQKTRGLYLVVGVIVVFALIAGGFGNGAGLALLLLLAVALGLVPLLIRRGHKNLDRWRNYFRTGKW